MPEHSPTDTMYIIVNMVRAVFRVAFVLLKHNINVGPLVAVALVMIPMYLLLGVLRLIILALRLLKLLPFL